ncbi:hypothetical protein IscW_ISCW017006 [Ixodes scapularis]|uniref:Uncharacterized protein n=1 Tax=Ixodes scapularis TaxID=6945 RepID=B7P976_IXOSC|nr:hypothetical protein IscW_ISCW017006 [Ixodes scapularis]|eukprot:XP_002403732.1 hypothetical protein IscW_ISCW017006 [Ixodes scapularis]
MATVLIFHCAGSSNVTLVTCIIFLMSFIMFLGHAMMKCFRDFGPIKYVAAKRKMYGQRPSPRKMSTVTVAPRSAIKKKRHVSISRAPNLSPLLNDVETQGQQTPTQ